MDDPEGIKESITRRILSFAVQVRRDHGLVVEEVVISGRMPFQGELLEAPKIIVSDGSRAPTPLGDLRADVVRVDKSLSEMSRGIARVFCRPEITDNENEITPTFPRLYFETSPRNSFSHRGTEGLALKSIIPMKRHSGDLHPRLPPKSRSRDLRSTVLQGQDKTCTGSVSEKRYVAVGSRKEMNREGEGVAKTEELVGSGRNGRGDGSTDRMGGEKGGFECPICRRIFGSKENLKRHSYTVHENMKPHICLQCDKGFGEKGTLNSHLITVHGKIDNFPCRLCPRKFAMKRELLAHERETHRGEMALELVCQVCSREFSHKSSLKKHTDTFHH